MTPLSCPSCGATLPEGATACAYCGRRVVAGEPALQSVQPTVEEPPARSRRRLLLVIVAAAAVLAIGMLALAAFLPLQAAESAPVPEEDYLRFIQPYEGHARLRALRERTQAGSTEGD